MIIDLPTGADAGVIYRAGEKIGAQVNADAPGVARTRQGERLRVERVTLRPLYPDTYRSLTPNGRKINAVCWHGHREWMRAIYAQYPEAMIRTGLATYYGAEHFEQTHAATHRNASCTCAG